MEVTEVQFLRKNSKSPQQWDNAKERLQWKEQMEEQGQQQQCLLMYPKMGFWDLVLVIPLIE